MAEGGISIQKDFIVSPRGILFIVAGILSLLAFICAMVWRFYEGAEWVQFVSITGFLIAVTLYILNVLNVYSQGPARQVPLLYMIEFGICVGWAVLFLIAGIVSAAAAHKFRDPLVLNVNGQNVLVGKNPAPIIAAAVFCFLALAAWAILSIFLFLNWRNNRDQGPTATTTTTTTTATTVMGPGIKPN